MSPFIVSTYYNQSVNRRKNTWYSVSNGNWSNPATWISNATKRWSYPGQNIPSPVFPQVGDDVYINNNITVDVNNLVVNNLRVSGNLFFGTSIKLSVYGDIQASGTVDMTGTNSNLFLYGVNNFIVNFVSGSSGTVTYAGLTNQPIMAISYTNLSTSGYNTKYLTANTTVAGNLSIASLNASVANSTTFETKSYNLSVTGTTTNANGAAFSASGAGNLLFTGMFSNFAFLGVVTFSGNPNIEFRGGINNYNYPINFGTGNIIFTTNSQTITQSQSGISTFLNVTITGAITLTVAGAGAFQINGAIDGTVGGSALVNKGILYLASTTLPMATHGTWDYTTYTTNTLGFVLNGNYTVPYTSFTGSLLVSGTGTKSLSGSTTIGGNFTISNVVSSGAFDPGYNLSVTGVTTIQSYFYCTTTSLSILFIGSIIFSGGVVDFSTGNPSVELRGGSTAFAIITSGSGSGLWSITTNNQTFAIAGGTIFDCNVLISGAITVTITNLVNLFILNGTINGDNASSILDNRGNVVYKNSTAPMVTGKIYCNQAANTFTYGALGNQDIQVPSDPTPGYKNLTLNGTGAKKLLGNVSVKGTYIITAPATLDSNGFSLTNP